MKYLQLTVIGLIFSVVFSFGQKTNLDQYEIVDLTHTFSEESVYWVTAKEFQLEEVAKGRTDMGFYYSANNFSTAEHGGTHIDAPIHFAENRQSVDDIPLSQLIGEAVKIDISTRALKDPDYLISINDIKAWETQNSRVPDESIILFETGYGQFYPDAKKYLGTDRRGPEAVRELHFPGLAPEAATWLIQNRKIKAVGLDTASIDRGQSTDFATHIALMTNNIPAFENIANLDKLPARGFQIIALPMKIKGGSGAPLRIIALKNQ
ncbi:cyclase family protein [Christiangramia sabulilitoris]|uniref:Cyclase family protein n=1 Tax=Christiangramia sabulilitoris TaxID=2583991 RepID=A0A550I7H1_9FLAO|nr:cyclase family protein [Christiangramia sabulilitoris]TRO66920.1 cyclase family protein [Christiangramia sabulilitoris]